MNAGLACCRESITIHTTKRMAVVGGVQNTARSAWRHLVAIDLRTCPVAPNNGDDGCHWCGGWLNARQTRWCSPLCISKYRRHHVWKYARPAAMNRDKVCVHCGTDEELEVNHIVPLAGRPRTESCIHHQTNLEVLCHTCHVQVTHAQRKRGEFPGLIFDKKEPPPAGNTLF